MLLCCCVRCYRSPYTCNSAHSFTYWGQVQGCAASLGTSVLLCENSVSGPLEAASCEIRAASKECPLHVQILKSVKAATEVRNSVSHSAIIFANALMHCGTTVDNFLRDNLDWLSRATNWAKFSATAGLGVIHRGHLAQVSLAHLPVVTLSLCAHPDAGASPADSSCEWMPGRGLSQEHAALSEASKAASAMASMLWKPYEHQHGLHRDRSSSPV